MTPDKLAPFESWSREALVWQRITEMDGHPGCLQLASPVKAKPLCGVIDDRCPTLSLVWTLKNMGWRSVQRGVKHDTLAIGDFDGRTARRMKHYLVTLLRIAKCLPLTSAIPSQEPVVFYRCLLAGLRVEPGTSHKDLLVVYNQDRQKRQKEPSTDAEADLLAIAPGSDDDSDGIMVTLPAGKAKAKARGGSPPLGRAPPGSSVATTARAAEWSAPTCPSTGRRPTSSRARGASGPRASLSRRARRRRGRPRSCCSTTSSSGAALGSQAEAAQARGLGRRTRRMQTHI
jgi:hypothetical protein